MLEVNQNQLSATEEKTAKQALQKAHEREVSALINNVRDRAHGLNKIEDLWDLHDLLSTKRYEIDGKYAYNSSSIVFDLAHLVKEKWLTLEDLQDLPSEMLSKISALARM